MKSRTDSCVPLTQKQTRRLCERFVVLEDIVFLRGFLFLDEILLAVCVVDDPLSGDRDLGIDRLQIREIFPIYPRRQDSENNSTPIKKQSTT